MLSQKTLSKLPVLAAVIVAAATVLAVLPGQDAAELAFATQTEATKHKESKMPRAVYSAQLPTDPGERAIRVARNSRYDKRYTVPFDESPPDTVARSSTNEWYLYVPALPTAESDAVVLGKVVDAKGYLSNDRTGAYSEFTILVERIFKDSKRSLGPGGSVVAEREGANVQLLDGRVITYQISYQGMPQVGQVYLLFLKYNEQGDDYRILTGYELRDNRVSPLDKADHFETYKNSSEETFINEVREAVVNPPRAPRGIGGLG